VRISLSDLVLLLLIAYRFAYVLVHLSIAYIFAYVLVHLTICMRPRQLIQYAPLDTCQANMNM